MLHLRLNTGKFTSPLLSGNPGSFFIPETHKIQINLIKTTVS